MTTVRGPDRQPDGAGPNGPGGFSYGKALAIVVVAIALGAYLLQLGGGHQSPPPAAATTPPTTAPSTTTTTTAPPTTGTSGQATPSSAVKVLVENASETNGVAGYYSTELSSAGWGTLTPGTALTVESTSTVYYASGQQANASAVASTLGVASSAVQALGPTAPVSGATGADVVVVAGEDLAGKVPASSTTTTTTS